MPGTILIFSLLLLTPIVNSCSHIPMRNCAKTVDRLTFIDRRLSLVQSPCSNIFPRNWKGDLETFVQSFHSSVKTSCHGMFNDYGFVLTVFATEVTQRSVYIAYVVHANFARR